MLVGDRGDYHRESIYHCTRLSCHMCSICWRENLLQDEGWKCFRLTEKRQKKLFRFSKQPKIRSYQISHLYKYGYQFTRNYGKSMGMKKSIEV